jgi:class 3 adenylate cyclase
MRSSSANLLDSRALLITDIAGSTRMAVKMGDLATHNLISAFYARAHKLASKHHGRIIKLLGDGFLSIFRESADAVKFGLALQKAFAKDEIALREGLTLRIGIHYGPISLSETQYGEDVFGLNVNLAARLQGLARPGEILISRAATEKLSDDERRLMSGPEVSVLKGIGEVEFSRVQPTG